MSVGLISFPVMVLVLQLVVPHECGTSTGRIYLTSAQQKYLCSLYTGNFNTSFCQNINADKYNIQPQYTDLMEETCQAIAKALNFSQGTCMQSKSKSLFGLITYITDACAITNCKEDIATLNLNQGNQWIFLSFGGGLGDETQCNCPNGLKDFDATL